MRLFIGSALAAWLVFLCLGNRPIYAQQDECSPDQLAQASQQLRLAEVYESQEEWNEASELYRAVAMTACPELAEMGLAGLERTLAAQNKLNNRLQEGLIDLLGSVLIDATKVLAVGLAAFLFIRFVLRQISSPDRWTVLPFLDETGQNRGEAFADGVVHTVHEMRLLLSRDDHAKVGFSFINELPTLTIIKQREPLLSALSGLDRLDVSGVGLPVGSLLANVLRWLDLGGKRIIGTIYEVEGRLKIYARLEEGRSGKCINIWHCEVPLTDRSKFEESFITLQRNFAYQMLLDTTSGNWGTRFATALQAFSEGYQALLSYFQTGSRDKNQLLASRNKLREAIQVDPTYRLAILQLAIAELNLDQNDAAISLLKRIEDQNGFETLAAYNLGVAWYQKRFDAAYNRAKVQFQKAIESAAVADPGKESNHELTALSYCGLISVAAQGIRSTRNPAQQLINEVNVYFAEATKNSAVLSKDVILQTRYAMGLWCLNSNQLDQAQLYISEAIEINPYHWRAYTMLGQIKLKGRKYDEAINEFTNANDLAPEFEFAYYQLGRAYSEQRKPDWKSKALDAFSKAPSIAAATLDRGRIIAEEYKQYDEAIRLYEDCLTRNPQNAEIHAAIAWHLAEGKMLDTGKERAIEAATKAVQLSEKKDWHKLDVLGRVLLDSGDIEQAERFLRDAYALNPKASPVNYHLAEIYYNQKSMDAARTHLITILKKRENSVWHQKAIELMKKIERASEQNLEGSV